MNKIINKKYLLPLCIALAIISAAVILITGNKYTIKIYTNEVNDINDIKVIIEDDIITCINKEIKNDQLILTFKSKKKGSTFVDVYNNEDPIVMFKFHINRLKIITYESPLGNTNGSIIISVSTLIIFLYILLLVFKSYKESKNISIYQYKNVAYLGLIIFLSFTVLNQVLTLFSNQGFINTLEKLVKTFSILAIVLLPIAFVLSIFVTISNIKLVIKEGFTIKNLLGVLLGLFICFTSILPEYLYRFTYNNVLINVHNERALVTYVYQFIETTIYFAAAYLECILIGTIVIAIKAAHHKPNYNKDYIIILGCMIKKDGSLTPLLKSRVDRAIEFSKKQKEATNKDIIFVPSGGQGSNEIISEAEAMKRYLISNGISEKNILIENKSTNTDENIKFSSNIINKKNKKANIAFSTTNYHVFRAGTIAFNNGVKMEGVGAKTKTYFWINAFIREFIATLYSEKKTHIKTIIYILLVSIIIYILIYLSNIL